jgi:non-specific serine/threonine protein kinase
VIPGLASELPPPRGLERRPNNLPLRQAALLGRERELAAVRELLLRRDVGLITLTGPGGTGKTRLGLRAASEALGWFADGAFVVNLAPISDPGLVLSAIAQTLGVREAAGRPLLGTLVEHLRDKQLLLLLDNFEQVLPAAPLVADLLTACPGLKVLATSRAPLHVSGEQQFPVPPLALPDPRRLPERQALARVPAVALFVQRAQAVRPDFTLSGDNAAAVAEVCIRLDGLPLAIELAAARAKVLSPRAILTRLQHRLDLLQGGAQDWPARHQTLRQAIGWSYDLLDEPEQRLFRRLAVFVGGWRLESMVPVVAEGSPSQLSGQLPITLLDGLASLVDQSLLREPEGAEQGVRFEMLETVRAYALEQLEASGEAEPLQQRHAAHFLELAELAASELTGPRQGPWLERLEEEHDNLRAALDWSTERGQAELSLRLAGALGRFWEVRGYLSEGQRWLERALTLGASVGPSPTASVLAAALNAAGTLAYISSDYERAAALFQDSLRLQRELGDRSGIATSLHNLARVRFYQGDHERAGALCEESLALRRELADKRGIAMSLNTLGVIARDSGDLASARALYEQSLGLFRELGDRWGIGLLLNNLARVARDLADWTWTAALCAESLALFREVGDRHGLAWVLSNLAIVARIRGDWERVARMFGAAEALAASVGSSSLSLSPVERGAYQAAAAAAKAALAPELFAAACAEGRRLPLDRLIAYALAPAEPAPASRPAPAAPGQQAAHLTRREREVAALVARGLTSRQIAAALVISERTADAHVEHIRTKLKLRSRVQIATWAIQQGLVGPWPD